LTVRCVLVIEREGIDLDVDLRGRRHIDVLGLVTRDLDSSSFCFRREDLEGISLGEGKFDLREGLDRRVGSLGMRPWREIW